MKTFRRLIADTRIIAPSRLLPVRRSTWLVVALLAGGVGLGLARGPGKQPAAQQSDAPVPLYAGAVPDSGQPPAVLTSQGEPARLGAGAKDAPPPPGSAVGKVLRCDWTLPHRVLQPVPPEARGPQWPSAAHGPQMPFGPGAYIDPGRTPHVPDYRLRVDDVLELVYRITRDETSRPYRLNVGDKVRVESLTEEKLNRELVIQPDGTITLLLLGQVKATGKTVEQLRRDLERRYRKFYKRPAITVTPIQVNTKLRDIINTVDSRFGAGGQVRTARVAPDGTISLPAVGQVPAQGLTLSELKQELDARYRMETEGIEVTPVLVQRAPRFVYVLGEVRNPGRFQLQGPTNVIQAISLAGGWNVGANLRQVVVFRWDDHWQIQATVLDVWDAVYGNRTCPVDDIWLSDSDVVLVPKVKMLVVDEAIDLLFQRGIYGVFPFQGASVNFSKFSTL